MCLYALNNHLYQRIIFTLVSSVVICLLHDYYYALDLLSGASNYNKILVHVSTDEDIHTYSLYLQKYCISTSRPVYYINHPEDLVCSADWMSVDDNGQAQRNKGPGGRLHAFLTAQHPHPPVLILNYDNFSDDDIVRFNEIIDQKRTIDGTLYLYINP